MHTLTRRRWLASVAGTGILSTVSPVPAWVADHPSEIIDAHAHVWSSDLKKYPLAPGHSASDPWYPSFSIEELQALARPAGVTRFNLVQTPWYGLDHSYMLDAIAKDPEHFVGTGVVPAVTDVSLPSPERTMVELARGGIYAFRVRGKSTRPNPDLADGQRWMDHPGYAKMFAAAAEHNLALSFLMGPSDLPEVDRMCRRFPETPVILDHFCLVGRQNRFVEEEIDALCRMAKHKRVMLKLGAFYALGKKAPPYRDMLPLIRRVVAAVGPERSMWESDAPKQAKDGHSFEAAVAVIDKHAEFLSAADKRQILVKTAEDFFFKRKG
jgi:predicted TIM-barrel fold metal-dependent hydrolase